MEWTNRLFGIILDWLLKSLMAGLKWIEDLPQANIHGIEWHWVQMVVMIIGIAALIMALNKSHLDPW